MTKVAIYNGTTLAAIYESDSPTAWRNAVLTCNIAAGYGAPQGKWERTPGRFSYTRGNFRAVSYIRADR